MRESCFPGPRDDLLTLELMWVRLPSKMSLPEKLIQVINSKPKEVEAVPSKKLTRIIEGSNVVQVIEGLAGQTPLKVSKEVIEDGRKMVVKAVWEKPNCTNQVVVSLTESSISFIGNNSTGNYNRLEGKALEDRELIENSVLKMFSDPSKI